MPTWVKRSRSIWLQEGVASLAELHPNADYAFTMQSALENQGLLSMGSLCQTFPQSASSAYLAYAQATSFTQFIHKNYGSSGLQRLMQQYLDGLGCSEGADAALGASLNTLELKWKQEALGVPVSQLAWQNLLPYLALMGVIIGIPLAAGLLARRTQSALH